MKSLVAGALLAIVSFGLAQAAETVPVVLSGDQLLSDCLSKDPDRVLICAGYIAGVADAQAISRAIEGRPPCMPVGTAVEQVKDVAVRYLRQHPDYGKRTAAGSVMNAIVDEWKCGEVGG